MGPPGVQAWSPRLLSRHVEPQFPHSTPATHPGDSGWDTSGTTHHHRHTGWREACQGDQEDRDPPPQTGLVVGAQGRGGLWLSGILHCQPFSFKHKMRFQGPWGETSPAQDRSPAGARGHGTAPTPSLKSRQRASQALASLGPTNPASRLLTSKSIFASPGKVKTYCARLVDRGDQEAEQGDGALIQLVQQSQETSESTRGLSPSSTKLQPPSGQIYVTGESLSGIETDLQTLEGDADIS